MNHGECLTNVVLVQAVLITVILGTTMGLGISILFIIGKSSALFTVSTDLTTVMTLHLLAALS